MSIDLTAVEEYKGISSVTVKKNLLVFSFKDTSYELYETQYNKKRKTLTLYVLEHDNGLIRTTPVHIPVHLPHGLEKIVIKAEKIKATSF